MGCNFRGILMYLLICLSVGLNAADWQWSVPLKDIISSETNDHPQSFLWIPPHCSKVRAVVVGQHNMLEEGIMEDEKFRVRMSKLGIAEIWITPGISQNWDLNTNIQSVFNRMLDSLTAISGYPELKYAPIIPIGHSAMATFPWNFAAQNPERTLALLSIKGDAPNTNLTGYGKTNLDWSYFDISGIPGLMIMGEYEWWDARLQPALDYKKTHPRTCVSFLCDAGRGHFDYSEQLVNYIGLFIEKAVKYRIPKGSTPNDLVKLIPLNPENGWLVERFHKDSIPSAKAALFANYKGDKNNAFWCFDKEMARKADLIYMRQRGKINQYLAYVSNNQNLKYDSKNFYRYLPKFEPDSDGVTFHLSSAFTDSLYLVKSNKHANTKSEITRICGPVVKVNDTTFRLQFYRMGLNNIKRTADICLMLANDGDKKYKSAVQQCLLKVPYPLNEGKEQKITFDSIPNIEVGEKSVLLSASSTLGMNVYFYIQDGPAKIDGSVLSITKIPPKAKFPLKVTVVAWQYGRNIEPKVQTAEPVTREFYIQK